MTYVEEILRKDEAILYQASVHWSVFLPGMIVIPIAVLGIQTPEDARQGQGKTRRSAQST